MKTNPLEYLLFDALAAVKVRHDAFISLSYNARTEDIMAEGYAKNCKSTIVPALRYRDAHKAIEWLVRALGFEKQAVYEGPNGAVMHAQLTFGNGMVMLGSTANDSEWSRRVVQPDEIGMHSTVTICLIVEDATAVYKSAKAAGAEIVGELAEMPYGGMAFGCRDPEGHLWSIGEYDPWAEPAGEEK